MVVCHLARGVLALGLFWGQGWQSALLTFVVLATCFEVLSAPTARAFIPEIVAPDALPRAVSGCEFTSHGSRILGALAGGLTSAHFGFTGVCVVNAVAYVMSALCMARIRQPGGEHVGGAVKQREPLLDSMRGGARYIRQHPNIPFVVGFFAVATAFFSAFPVILPVAVTSRLNVTDATYGTLVSANALGALIGTVLTVAIGKTRHKLQWMTAGVCSYATGTYLLVTTASTVIVSIATYALMG